MKKKSGGQAVMERQLFHGTCSQNVNAICQQGFDFRNAGTRVGKIYGSGSYYAKKASYSVNYTDSNKLIVARVLAGDYTDGHSEYVKPPSKDPSKPLENFYDSCVDSIADPTIFIIFTHQQVYPEYLIDFITM